MPLYLEVDDKNLSFNIEVVPLTKLSEINQHDILKKIADFSAVVKAVYDNAIKKNNKILGQDRIKLLESIDSLFIYIVLLSNSLKNNLSKEHLELLQDIEFKVPFENKGNKFYSSSVLDEAYLANIKNFNDFFQNSIMKKIKDLFINFKQVIIADEIAVDRVKSICLDIDDVFYNIVGIRYKIKNCLIDS